MFAKFEKKNLRQQFDKIVKPFYSILMHKKQKVGQKMIFILLFSTVASSRRRSRHGLLSASDEDDEAQDTLSSLQQDRCLLDVLSISLSSMDLRTADRLSVFTG